MSDLIQLDNAVKNINKKATINTHRNEEGLKQNRNASDSVVGQKRINGNDPQNNLPGYMESDKLFENMEMGLQFQTFKSSLPIAMQGLSVNALKTYFQVQRGRLDKTASNYMNEERADWINQFKEKINTARGTNNAEDPDDSFKNMSFTELVNELRGHWNINPGNDYTNFKNAVLDFESYTFGESFDVKEYTEKYRNTIEFIDAYVASHEGAKSVWGKKRLRMAKSIRTRMQRQMEPESFFIDKFENLGGIEVINLNKGLSNIPHESPDFAKMSKNGGNIGVSAEKALGNDVSAVDLVKQEGDDYTFKPIVSTMLISTEIKDTGSNIQNTCRMYKEVNEQSAKTNKSQGIGKDFFAKTVIISTISQKVTSVKSILSNTNKIKDDIAKKKAEDLKELKRNLKIQIKQKDEKQKVYGDAKIKYDTRVDQANGEEVDLNTRIRNLEREFPELDARIKKGQDEIDRINAPDSEYSQTIEALDNEENLILIELNELKNIDEIPDDEAEKYEEEGKSEKLESFLDEKEENLLNFLPDYGLTNIKDDLERSQKLYNDGTFYNSEKNKIIERNRNLRQELNLLNEKRAKLLEKQKNQEALEKKQKEYDELALKTKDNPIIARQNSLRESYKKLIAEQISTLITGPAAELYLAPFDKKNNNKKKMSKAAQTALDNYKKLYYDPAVIGIKTNLENVKKDYIREFTDRSIAADKYNKSLEENVRKSMGLAPNDPIPAYVKMYKMPKMEDDMERIIDGDLSYTIPKLEDIADKEQRDKLISKYGETINYYKNLQDKSILNPVDTKDYEDSIKKINSEEYSDINYVDHSVKEESLEELEERSHYIIEEINLGEKDLEVLNKERNGLQKRIKELRFKYNKERIRYFKDYAKNNRRVLEKQHEDEKLKAIKERDEAIEKIKNGDMKDAQDRKDHITYTKDIGINALKAKLSDIQKEKDELKNSMDEAKKEFDIANETVNKTNQDITELNQMNEDYEAKKIHDTIEDNKAEYEKEEKKLGFLNEALAQYFYLSEGAKFGWDNTDGSYDALEKIYRNFALSGKAGVLSFKNDIDNTRDMMALFIEQFANALAESSGIRISKMEAENMTDTVIKMYKKINENIKNMP